MKKQIITLATTAITLTNLVNNQTIPLYSLVMHLRKVPKKMLDKHI